MLLYAMCLAILGISSVSALPSPSTSVQNAKPEQIRGVASPIYHLYLQASRSDASKPVLGPEASADTFNIGTAIQSSSTAAYLNIGSAIVSFKPLSFSPVGNTTAWGLEGDTIITAQSSSYGRQLNFLVCGLTGGYYELYLQTGSDVPSGKTCNNYQTLHLPCLC